MKKIIYIANSRIPTKKAHGFQIMKMCEAFSNAGIKVELWIPRRFNPIKESPFNYYSIHETFAIKKIPVIDLIPLSRFLGAFANFVESVSFAIFVLFTLRSGLTRIKADQRGSESYPCESAINPHKSAFNEVIIYSRDQIFLWFLSFISKKFVYEIHSFPGKPIFYKRIWQKARKIVTVTEALKNLVANQGVNGEKILAAPDAVDLAAFNAVSDNKEELRMELELPAGDFLVGYIGKFNALGVEKGIKTMIEALPLLDKETKMVFVGGEESEIVVYKALAGRLNVLNRSVFIGHQPYSQVVKFMKAMDALVIPSPNKPHFALYSSPLKLFEYMASGRPIIASDLPALREILNDKNALFFKPENPADLARAIKMLKSSKTLGLHLSRQALADVKQYTWDSRAKNILEFINLS